MNGLSLFSGIGGIDVALSEWVKPIAYCEIDTYCQSILLQRMSEGYLPKAPIWDDIRTLSTKELPRIDIIYGGFPCQDISVAGCGKGLEGERSGLFFEIMRLVRECRPTFVFLENVPAIRIRGMDRVLEELAKERYDCRWTMLSAAEVGARHKRERWFLLGYSESFRTDKLFKRIRKEHNTSNKREDSKLADASSLRCNEGACEGIQSKGKAGKHEESSDVGSEISNANSTRLQKTASQFYAERIKQHCFSSDYWTIEPSMGRVVNGLPNRVDRIKALGNAVVPLQATTAFKRLMGQKPLTTAKGRDKE